MKANEAPEKIYIPSDLDWQTETCIMNKRNVDDIEYTRTDAFIERAAKYLYEYNQKMAKKYGAKAVLSCSDYTINVTDFKNYIKGE